MNTPNPHDKTHLLFSFEFHFFPLRRIFTSFREFLPVFTSFSQFFPVFTSFSQFFATNLSKFSERVPEKKQVHQIGKIKRVS